MTGIGRVKGNLTPLGTGKGGGEEKGTGKINKGVWELGAKQGGGG